MRGQRIDSMRSRDCQNIVEQRSRIRFKRSWNGNLQQGWEAASIQIVQSEERISELAESAAELRGRLDTDAMQSRIG